MLNRIFILTFSLLALMATSFCVQKQEKNRYISSGGDVSNFEGPTIIDADVGEVHIYYKVQEHPVKTTSLVVKYLCDPKDEPKVLMDKLVAHFVGTAGAYSWKELAELTGKPAPSDSHHKKSVVILKFHDIQLQHLRKTEGDQESNKIEADPSEGMQQARFDLTQWCQK